MGRSRGSPIVPLLACVWLAACLTAPYLPPTNPIGVLFGMAPPLALVAPPLLAMLLLTIRIVRRRKAGANAFWLLGIGLATFSLLSFAWNFPHRGEAGKGVSVMTFNVNKESRQMPALLDYLKRHPTDLVFLQENKGGPSSPASYLQKNLPGWHMASGGEVATLSRWPLENVRIVPLWSQDTRVLLSADVAGPRRFRAMTVHWSIPQFSGGFAAMRNGAARQARDCAQTMEEAERSDLPLVLGGDFNNPPHHALTRRLSERLENCFSAGGFGVGWTYPSPRPWTRIDHLYVSDGFRTETAKVGPNLGSDHLPLLAQVKFLRNE